MTRWIGRSGLMAVMVSAVFGQSTPASLAFEVASVRPHHGPLSRIFDFSSSGPRVTLVSYPVKGLIMEAYKLKGYQVTFAASVLQPEEIYYDIVATAPGSGTPNRGQFRQMLQTLLAERFNLRVHRELKEMPVYALVVGKNGPKFKESASDATFIGGHGANGRNQTVTASKYTMTDLVQDIVDYFFVDRPVVDKTGFAGTYDLKIEATPEFRMNRDSEFGDISVFTAVQEQLGLKLESQRAPIEILVVDQVEKPSAN
jgi:uncharacterized protein (TIGR03435 family)